jgi:hypothetical protein
VGKARQRRRARKEDGGKVNEEKGERNRKGRRIVACVGMEVRGPGRARGAERWEGEGREGAREEDNGGGTGGEGRDTGKGRHVERAREGREDIVEERGAGGTEKREGKMMVVGGGTTSTSPARKRGRSRPSIEGRPPRTRRCSARRWPRGSPMP